MTQHHLSTSYRHNPKWMWLLLIGIAIGITACEDPIPQKANDLIAQADGGTIEFAIPSFRPDKPDLINMDKKGLELMQGWVEQEKTEAFKCGTDGTVTFKKGESDLLKIDFTLAESCTHLSFHLEGTQYFYRMKAETLEKLKKNMCAPAKISELAWMNGKWAQTENDGSESYETWATEGEKTLRGRTFSLKGTDTLFSEPLQINSSGPILNYKVTLSPQAPATDFKLSFLNGERVMFENRGQDFPQIILYQMRGADTLHSRIEGLYGGHPYAKDFYLHRVSN